MEAWQIILIVIGAYFLVLFLYSLLIYIFTSVRSEDDVIKTRYLLITLMKIIRT